MNLKINSTTLDKLGITASIGCAIHCAGLPLLMTFLPMFGLEFLANGWVEVSMIGISVFVGGCALIRTYANHKSLTPLIILVIGFLIIGIGHYLGESMEATVVPIGGLTIAFAHYKNWKLGHLCSHNHT
jgi:hypothetical protein